MQRKSSISVTLGLGLAALIVIAGPGQGSRGVALADVPGQGSKTFPETGKTVKGLFLDYWNGNGGLPQQGYPISDEMQEKSDLDGKTYSVQYFERAVFEYHPENQKPYDVLLSQLGTTRFKARYPQGEPGGVSITLPAGAGRTPCSATNDDPPGPYQPNPPIKNSVGKGHIVRGFVLSSVGCVPITGAKVDMWPEVAGVGHDPNDRAAVLTDATGAYWYESRPPEHIHMHISAPGYKTIYNNGYHPAPGMAEGTYNIVLAPDPDCRTFAETGQSTCGVFLKYWQEHGGLAQQGYPISREFSEKSDLDGKTYTVQYFERAVFEKHAENQAPYDVLLSQLGTFTYKARYGTAQPEVTPTPKTEAYNGPPGRAGHDLVYDDALKMVLLVNGGDVADEAPGTPGKIWGWDGHEWRVVSANGPEVRSLGGVAYDSKRNVLVMYGGGTESENYNDTWEWDGKNWSKKNVQGPGFRHHFSMFYDPVSGEIVAYGGNLQVDDSLQSEMTFPTDTWLWNGTRWKQAATTGPGVRYHYGMAYDSVRKMGLLFGGAAGSSNRNDLWSWDGDKWSEQKSSGTLPERRWGVKMAFDEQRGKLIMFGGLVGLDVMGDTWSWGGTQWTKLNVAGASPPARSHHAMEYDKARGKIVMFGGIESAQSAVYRADTWEWDGAAWAKVAGP